MALCTEEYNIIRSTGKPDMMSEPHGRQFRAGVRVGHPLSPPWHSHEDPAVIHRARSRRKQPQLCGCVHTSARPSNLLQGSMSLSHPLSQAAASALAVAMRSCPLQKGIAPGTPRLMSFAQVSTRTLAWKQDRMEGGYFSPGPGSGDSRQLRSQLGRLLPALSSLQI